MITKVLRHVIEKWRKDNIKCFIHIEIEAEKVSRLVRKDLESFGLACIWVPTKSLVWTASLCGMLIIFRNCVGEDVSRFHTRRMNIQIA